MRWCSATAGAATISAPVRPESCCGRSPAPGDRRRGRRSAPAARIRAGPSAAAQRAPAASCSARRSGRLAFSTPVPFELSGGRRAGQAGACGPGTRSGFALHHRRSWQDAPLFWSQAEIARRLTDTLQGWTSWSGLHQNYQGPWQDLVAASGRLLQALTLLSDRGDRGRSDHVPARGRRRHAQLGLPLHLGPGRQHDPAGAVGGGLPGRGRESSSGSSPRPPPASWPAGGPADHVRHRRGTGPRRTGTAPPARLAGQRPGPGRQRRLEPAPARCLRRTARRRRHPPGIPGRAGTGDAALPRRRGGRCRGPLAGTRTRGSGRSAANRGTTCIQNSCAGWPWTGPSRSPDVLQARRTGFRAGSGRRDQIAASIRAERLERRPRTPIPRRTAPSELDASALMLADRRASFRPDDPRMPRHDRGHRADRLTDSRGLVYRYRGDDGLPGRRARSCSAPSGWPRRWPWPATRTGPGWSSSGPPGSPPNWACWPRRSRRTAASCWAIFRRLSATSDWSTQPGPSAPRSGKVRRRGEERERRRAHGAGGAPRHSD